MTSSLQNHAIARFCGSCLGLLFCHDRQHEVREGRQTEQQQEELEEKHHRDAQSESERSRF